MKKRLQGAVAGLLVGITLAGGVVYAKQTFENAQLYYNNIKVYIDGMELVPKDANGNTVEPFTMNGTTYLPVRAVANAFGKEVEWDGATQSVYIGKKDFTKPDNYLHKIQYNDLEKGVNRSSFSIIKSPIKDVDGESYTNGLLFDVYDYYDQYMDVYYPLNSQYKKLTGNIVLPAGTRAEEATVTIYGDENEVLYKAVGVTYSMPFTFEVDVYGVNQLRINVKIDRQNFIADARVALTDLALYK